MFNYDQKNPPKFKNAAHDVIVLRYVYIHIGLHNYIEAEYLKLNILTEVNEYAARLFSVSVCFLFMV